MKRFCLSILLTVLMSMVCTIAFAYDIEAKNADGVTIYYNWNYNGTELTVCSRSHADNVGVSDCNDYNGDVVIPESVEYKGKSYKVSSICFGAFSGCRGLTSVTIPNSITSIEGVAFSGCESLNSITIPSSVTTIGEDAFVGTKWFDNFPDGLVYIGTIAHSYKGEMPDNTHIEIREGTTSISGRAFYNCNNLTSVNIPNSVTTVGSSAFAYCKNLSIVNIPNSVSNIGRYAFKESAWENNQPDGLVYAGKVAYEYKGDMLENTIITLDPGTIGIAGVAFENRKGLTSVIIPNSVTSIGEYAFWGSGLTSVTIPKSVTSIGNSAFSSCNSLSCISVDGENQVYDSRENCNAIIETATNILHSGCNSTNIPHTITSIAKDAFYGCSSLTSVTIPKTVSYIGKDAFYGCGSLTNISVETGNQVYDSRDNCNAIIETSSETLIRGCNNTIIPNGVTSIGDGAFYSCRSLTSLIIPNSVTSIGHSAFSSCSSLASVNIPNGVKYIGEQTFYDCKSLTSITIPNSVMEIGAFSFIGCGLTAVSIPNSVKGIGSWAFSYCGDLLSVIIPNSVTDIADHAFIGCNSLVSVTIKKKEPLYLNYGTFSNPANATLYVPMGSKAAYEAVYYWKDFKEIVEIDMTPDDDSTLSGSCGETVNYQYDKATQTLTISGKGAIYDYDNGSNQAPWSSYSDEIQKIEIESGITSVGYFAFYKCSNITSLSVPATVGYIGSSAFEDCKSLASLSLNDGLLSIGGSAFESCIGLKTLTIPSTVNSISINAFKNCKGITDVYCYAEAVPNTHFDAFDATPTEKSTLHVPAKAVELYRTSWPWSDFKAIVVLGSRGDANSDGVIDDRDIYAIVDYIVKGKTEGFNFNNADVNGDQKVNVADIVKIINMIKK